MHAIFYHLTFSALHSFLLVFCNPGLTSCSATALSTPLSAEAFYFSFESAILSMVGLRRFLLPPRCQSLNYDDPAFVAETGIHVGDTVCVESLMDHSTDTSRRSHASLPPTPKRPYHDWFTLLLSAVSRRSACEGST